MKRARDYGLTFGEYPTGAMNRITDVPGVTVGHWTVDDETHRTGVTVICPCADNPYVSKPVAASYVLNGYGKTQGLVQVDELGTLETPIALTNTLNVGLVHNALVGWMTERCRQDGIELTSVNPVVAECNDAPLNDIAHRVVRLEQVYGALLRADRACAEGDVGAGRGMGCHGLKGGIGTASRILTFEGRDYTLGTLVLTNHGRLSDLRIDGRPVGERILQMQRASVQPTAPEPSDKGSCIMVLATDLPLDSRQLRRVLLRMSVGLARLGSYIGPQSGEVMLGFTNGRRVPLTSEQAVYSADCFDENRLEDVFRAAAQATEESVLNAMFAAHTTVGYKGAVRPALSEYLPDALEGVVPQGQPV